MTILRTALEIPQQSPSLREEYVQEWGHVDWFDYCLVSTPSNVGIRQVSNDY